MLLGENLPPLQLSTTFVCQSHALRPADVINVPKHVAADTTATKISAIKIGRYVDMEQTTVPKKLDFCMTRVKQRIFK